MKKDKFCKIPKSVDEQLELLKERGMIIEDEVKALFLLEKISYFRLSGYWFNYYINRDEKVFSKSITFGEAFNIYLFDKDLRKIILSELEKIEIAVRAEVVNTLSMKYMYPFWFSDLNLFKDKPKQVLLIDRLKDDFNRSDELFVESFKNKYSDEIPPSWIILEITSFGTLSKIFKNLNNVDKRIIANKFYLPEKVFESWLHTLVYIRNVCAHHTRLWNRNITIAPKILHNKKNDWMINTK